MAQTPVVFEQSGFDPTKDTLRSVINAYMVEGREQGRPLQNWDRDFYNIAPLVEYLDKPIIEIFKPEFSQGKDSPLQRANREASKSTLTNINAKMRGLYEETMRQIDRLEPDVIQEIKPDSLINPSGKFKKAVAAGVTTKKAAETQVAQADFKYRFVPEKMGDFYAKAMEHALNNPQDAPAINAFLFNIQIGMRPDEVTSLTDANLHQARTSSVYIERAREAGLTELAERLELQSGRPFLTGYIAKTKTLLDAPLSSHALAIIAQQQQLNTQLEGKYGKSGQFISKAGDVILGKNIFMMEDAKGPRAVTPQDITDVLKKIEVPGIIEEIRGDGSTIPQNFIPTSYDARRINATMHKFVGTDIKVAAQLKGRGVSENVAGAGREGTYRRLAFGYYPIDHIKAQDDLSKTYIQMAQVSLMDEQYEKFADVYRQPISSNFVPTAVLANPDGGYTYPRPTDGTPPIKLTPPSESPRALNPDFRTQVDAATPSIVVESDADYDEIYQQAGESDVPKVVEPAPVQEDLKNKFAAEYEAATGKKLLGLGALGTLGVLASYSEGAQAAKEAGIGETGQVVSGIGKTIYDIWEPLPLMGVYSEKIGVDPDTGRPIDAKYTPRETKIMMEQGQSIEQFQKREQAIEEQKSRIAAYDKEMAERESTGSLDDQMNKLQGIKPDIEVTYPKTEGIQ